MEELTLHIMNVVAPVLLCVLVGFGLAKLERPFDNKVITMLVSNAGYPTLIISHLAAGHVAFDDFLEMMAGTLAMVACFGIIAFGFLSLFGLPRRAFPAPLTLNNVGNIGLPLCTLAFGAAGAAYASSLALAHLFGFAGVARGVFILMCMMPVSVATYLWVDMYDPDRAPDVAGLILISTLLTVFVLPLVLTFWI